jgi:CxxC motif-containing protein (DUF1111 family)
MKRSLASMTGLSTGLLASLCLAACQPSPSPSPAVSPAINPAQANTQPIEQATHGLPEAALPGGTATFVDPQLLSSQHSAALSQPFANLGREARQRFVVGNAFFTSPWVEAGASAAGRDGLGPLFNAAACQDCHVRDGRGHPPETAQQAPTSAVVRIALPSGEDDPTYGRHLHTRAVLGLSPEVQVRVQWQPLSQTLPDGSRVPLRRPQLLFSQWAQGRPSRTLRSSLRIAPAMTGMALLESIPEADLRAYAVAQRAWGVRGLPQQVQGRLGRFGWKASTASVRQQALDAFVNDIGITSSLFPVENCTAQQSLCQQHGGRESQPELEPAIEEALVFYAQHLAPTVRRQTEDPTIQQGMALFNAIGCAACHKAHWRTGTQTGGQASSPAAANQSIWPYTDLLLHDMGAGLADGIVEGQASGQHWRTPPLWGLGQVKAVGGEKTGYLHDGRARTLLEAIVWHGGEGQKARDAFAALPADQRKQVLAFLDSL